MLADQPPIPDPPKGESDRIGMVLIAKEHPLKNLKSEKIISGSKKSAFGTWANESGSK